MLVHIHSHCRVRLTFPTRSDNTTAEASANSLFSTKFPLCLVLEKIGFLAALHAIKLDVTHIPGPQNDAADLLSRWDGQATLPSMFSPQHRTHLSLASLWQTHASASVYPPNSTLAWLRS